MAKIAPNSMCTWKITTGSGFSLETEFYSYSLCGTTPMGCDFCGYVKIWDGRRPDLRLIGTYCTNQRKNPVRSTGKYMFVEFYGHRDMTTFEASIMSRKGKFNLLGMLGFLNVLLLFFHDPPEEV